MTPPYPPHPQHGPRPGPQQYGPPGARTPGLPGMVAQRPALPPGPVTWVASVPPGSEPAPKRPRKGPYTGPPAYPAPPRWGFPQLAWRRPTSVPGHAGGPGELQRVQVAARAATSALGLAAVAAVLAAAGETWRYVLLSLGLTEQLTEGTLVTSDVLLDAASLLTMILAVLSVIVVLVWALRAYRVLGRQTGVEPARPRWQLVGVFVPVVNLVLPFSLLAELEHAALGDARGPSPSPSRLVFAWWVTWLLSGVCFTAELLWPLRGTSMQALADGVILHAFGDLAAAALAGTTLLLVRRITALLDPGTTRRAPRLVVRAAGTEPQRRERPVGATR